MVSAIGRRSAIWLLLTMFAAAASIAWSPLPRAAHPLHTTISEVTFDPATRAVQFSIRVFTDDLSAALLKRRGSMAQPGDSVTDAEALAYARTTIRLVGRDGRPLPLTSCGTRALHDLTLVCFTAPAPGGPSALRLRQGMLLELYDDQVNVVQTLYGPRRRSLLFTRSTSLQQLP